MLENQNLKVTESFFHMFVVEWMSDIIVLRGGFEDGNTECFPKEGLKKAENLLVWKQSVFEFH